jgi:tripartite-type tricarboxylate transporter receptor subunit TctC
VKADSPFKSFADVIAAAKKAPGTVRAATTGILSDDHLAILMTEEATGAHFRIVHLDGNANQLKETLAGNVDVAFDNVGGAIKPVKAGQGRALLVTDALRSKFLPHVPTSVELGFPTIISNSTRGITAPKGTPPEVLAKLGEILRKAMAEPEHNEKLEAQGLTVKVMIGDDYAKFYNEAHEKAKKYVAWSRERSQK